MSDLKVPIKKTGHLDIDELLISNYSLLQKSHKLQMEIEKALKFKPVDPFSSRNKKRQF
jgi:hypothetical protein